MDFKELSNLISFPLGIPSIYKLRLGMLACEIEDYQVQLDQKETDDNHLNEFLRNYDVMVEATFDNCCGRVFEISVSVSVQNLSESQIKSLYNYYVFQINTIDKNFVITTNSDDTVKVIDANIRSDLFNVSIKLTQNHNYVLIIFSVDSDAKLDMLRCLTIIERHDADFFFDMIKYFYKN